MAIEIAKSETISVEYRVKPVTRFIVTCFQQSKHGSGVRTCGEYENEGLAYEVGYALASEEHRRLGYPLGDDRIKYPEPLKPRIDPHSGPVVPA